MKFNIFELGIFSFNSCVYYLTYLTRGFIASTRAFNLATRAFSLLTRGFKLVTRGFKLVTREFELVTSKSELVTRGFELVTRNSCFSLFHHTPSYESRISCQSQLFESCGNSLREAIGDRE